MKKSIDNMTKEERDRFIRMPQKINLDDGLNFQCPVCDSRSFYPDFRAVDDEVVHVSALHCYVCGKRYDVDGELDANYPHVGVIRMDFIDDDTGE